MATVNKEVSVTLDVIERNYVMASIDALIAIVVRKIRAEDSQDVIQIRQRELNDLRVLRSKFSSN